MTEKEIFYSILGREIDNLCSANPGLAFFSTGIKNWIFNFIDPYLTYFMEGDRLQVDMATSFMKQEINEKIESFKKNFNKEITTNENK